MDTKYCVNCEETKSLEKFTLNPDGSIRKHICKACYARKWRAQLKLEMLEEFGWRCQCCNEDNPHFLTLDHINNDGNKHRAEVKSGSVEMIYSQAKKEGWPKDRYQLLCINCNWAKGKWGVCPHKISKTSVEIIEELKSNIFHTGKSLQDYSNNKGLQAGPKVQHDRAVLGRAIAVKPEKVLEDMLKSNPALVEQMLKLLKV
jgi:hypothetical protein